MSILFSPGANAYIGCPRFMSGSAYVGLVTVMGASKNSSLQGWGQYKGVSAAAEAIFGMGISLTEARAIATEDTNRNGKLQLSDNIVDFTDPLSRRQVVTSQLNIVGSANAIPNAFDAGYLTGYNYTVEFPLFRLPWWPFRRNE